MNNYDPSIFSRKNVGAYRIRPHMGEHAPQTMKLVQNHHNTTAHMKGVCDTPLHITAKQRK